MKKAKKEAIRLVKAALDIPEEILQKAVRILPNSKFGDLTVETRTLEDLLSLSPGTLAKQLQEKISLTDYFSKISADNSFVNFTLNPEKIIFTTLTNILSLQESYGSSDLGVRKKVLIDYSAPNIGKPLHVGHIRSTILGDSIVKILQFCGYTTHGINYLGDVGLHIGKILYAFKHEGDERRLSESPEKELLELYVNFCKKEKDDPSLTTRAQEEVQLIEAGDTRTMALLQKISAASMTSFERVYNRLKVHIDETTGQSFFSDKGKAIIFRALEKGLAFKKENGALAIELESYKLPEKIVLRADGTAIYSTQDIGSAVDRYEKHQFDQLLYVVGEAQELYFRQLFAALEKIGYTWSNRCKHIGFGLIQLQEGKMATRDGAIIYLEELLQKAVNKSAETLKEKRMDLEDLDNIAHIIGIGAVKYQILSIDRIKDITFSWDKALNFDGKASPYIQYSVARARSILRKSGTESTSLSDNKSWSAADLQLKEEYALIKKMAFLSIVVEQVLEEYKPHLLANYSFELAKNFNDFYREVHVLEQCKEQSSRLALVSAYVHVQTNALRLLGIEVPPQM